MKLKLVPNIKNALRYGDRPHPERDWFIMLGILSIVLVAGVAWNILFFLRVTNEDEVTAAFKAGASLNLDALEEARAAFEARAAEAARYQSEYQFVDPSR